MNNKHGTFLKSAKSPIAYLTTYSKMLNTVLEQVSADVLERIVFELKECINRKSHVYVAGNGGSSAIAAHLCCDWMKGTHVEGIASLKVHSLTENSALLTALSNDLGYENALYEQVKMLGEKGDILILISSSGNSSNIIRAVQAARLKKMKVISFTGFNGGKLATISNWNIHIPVENYGIVEDCHQILMHTIAQFLFLQRSVSRKSTNPLFKVKSTLSGKNRFPAPVTKV